MSAPSEDFTCLDEPPAPQSTPLACVSHFSRFPTSHYQDELLSRDISTGAAVPKSSVGNSAEHPQAIENMVQPRAPPRRLHALLHSTSADALVAEEHENESHTQQQAQDSLTGGDRPLLKRRPSLYEDFKKNVYQRLHMFSK
ncbi:AaceriAEL036Wp [[Ashbya] aceris (nom. inval.)]|nr:AaceriAEL036Wp [[Ashbya] aceris (nom. inval.)]